MYSTLLLALVAASPMAPAQTFGAYGSYGGGYFTGSHVLPYYVYPFIDFSGEDEAAKHKKQLEKKLADANAKFNKVEQRVLGLERLLSTMEPYLKAQETVAEERFKSLEKSIDANRSSEIAHGLGKLEERLQHLEQKIRTHDNDALLSRLDALGTTSRNIDDRLVKLENNIGQDGLAQRIDLLHQHLRIKDDLEARGKQHEQSVLDHKLTQNFEKLQAALTPVQNGKEVNRRLNRAVVIIALPADARLFINGMESSVGSNLRTFITPELENGKHYFYTMRAEINRNGELVTDTQRVYFQKGDEVNVSFEHLEAGAAAAERTN